MEQPTRFCVLTRTSGGLVEEHSMTVNLYATGSDDPIAFAYGFHKAMSGQKMIDKGEKRREMAKEYLRGYALGSKVRRGKAPMPAWARKV